MATDIQAARLLTYWAATRSTAGSGPTLGGRDGQVLRVGGGAARHLEAMRIHGGYGYSQEFVVERLYRDAPLMAIGEGTNDILRLVIARSLVSGKNHIGW